MAGLNAKKALKSIRQIIGFLDDEPLDMFSDAVEEETVSDLTLDSRQVTQQSAFLAVQGSRGHGLDYLPQALQAGVKLVISDRALTQSEQAWLASAESPPELHVTSELNVKLAALADWFYDSPSQRIKVIGITGTNGKTSTAHYVAQLLLALGQKPALIGTLGNGLVKSAESVELEPSANTTPDVVSVHRLLHQFSTKGANWVVMEVSSHALELGRIEQVHFECVALTQVTRDHLDFHLSETHYRAAKAKLFRDYSSRVQVLNRDDALGRELIKISPNALVYGINTDLSSATEFPPGELVCSQYHLAASGIQLALHYVQAECDTQIHLMGRFTLENVLCASGILLACGFDWAACCHTLPKLKAVKGRMEVVHTQPTVIVDFAHTADALHKVLKSVKAHRAETIDRQTEQASSKEGVLWVVFGCGGDRDRGKRPHMAQSAEAIADRVVLTSDNPRHEDPQQIFNDTLAGFKAPQNVNVIEDRKAAIEWALQQAKPEDLIVVAGKGHEAYQQIGDEKRPFSDQQTVLDWFAAQTERV